LYNDCKTRYLSENDYVKQDVVSNLMFNANVDDLNEYNIAPIVINTLPNTVDFVLERLEMDGLFINVKTI
jgi:hypothetical protein